jgi:hypothetical protein
VNKIKEFEVIAFMNFEILTATNMTITVSLECDAVLFDGKVLAFLEELAVYTYGRKCF